MTIESIAKTLGTGSGIDTSALIEQLVDNQFAVRNEALTAKSEALKAQISGVSELKSGISGFASALSTLARSGTLSTQPTSSNPNVAKLTALTGATVTGLSGSLEVRQLAAPQVASMVVPVSDKTAPVGTGTLTIALGTATVENGAMTGFTAGGGTPIDITITSANSSLTGIASAINAAKAGVTASVITDATGSRLVLKGANGAAQAFTVGVTEDVGTPGLSALAVGVGASTTSINAIAQDSIAALDGVTVQRASNTLNDVIAGVRIDLVSASSTPVSIGTSAPAAALERAVSDVVETYNQLLAMVKEQTDSFTGVLRSDPAAKALQRSMAGLTLTPLTTGDPDELPTTLAALGVATNRDGTLRVDAARLTRVLTENPEAVEAMFKSGAGLPAALNKIAATAADPKVGLGVSQNNYTRAQLDLADEQARALEAADALRNRMTQQFAAMDARVAAYKATQGFLEQQIDAWNARNA